MDYRAKIEVTDEILRFCLEPHKSTSIAYATFINFGVLKCHVNFLLKDGLLIRVGDNEYQTTEKGKDLLNCFALIRNLAPSLMTSRKVRKLPSQR